MHESVHDSLQRQIPYIPKYPDSPVTSALRAISDNLVKNSSRSKELR
jgi:hypothetical protein